MIQEGHLKVYDLLLRVNGPLHIGSGVCYTKKEYCFDSRSGTVSFLDQHLLFELLLKKKLIDYYESFILGNNSDLYVFLTEKCGISPEQIRRITRYSMDARDALDKYHSLEEIHGFMRDPYERPYVPGSSVKGAIRTVLLTDMICKQPMNGTGDSIEQIESHYFNTLNCKKTAQGQREDNAVNSMMRGIQISDSCPVSDEELVLCSKWDFVYQASVHKVNMCRECLRPGTELSFKLTLDESVLHNTITVDELRKCIVNFCEYYWNRYIIPFCIPVNDSGEQYQDTLILGGGAGYFSKTVAYPYYGDEAVNKVSAIMNAKYSNRHPERDTDIVPRTMKYTEYQGKLYPYGVCQVELQ